MFLCHISFPDCILIGLFWWCHFLKISYIRNLWQIGLRLNRFLKEVSVFVFRFPCPLNELVWNPKIVGRLKWNKPLVTFWESLLLMVDDRFVVNIVMVPYSIRNTGMTTCNWLLFCLKINMHYAQVSSPVTIQKLLFFDVSEKKF